MTLIEPRINAQEARIGIAHCYPHYNSPRALCGYVKSKQGRCINQNDPPPGACWACLELWKKRNPEYAKLIGL